MRGRLCILRLYVKSALFYSAARAWPCRARGGSPCSRRATVSVRAGQHAVIIYMCTIIISVLVSFFVLYGFMSIDLLNVVFGSLARGDFKRKRHSTPAANPQPTKTELSRWWLVHTSGVHSSAMAGALVRSQQDETIYIYQDSQLSRVCISTAPL